MINGSKTLAWLGNATKNKQSLYLTFSDDDIKNEKQIDGNESSERDNYFTN